MSKFELFNLRTFQGKIRFFGIIFILALVLAGIFVFNVSRIGPMEACLEDCSSQLPHSEGELLLMNLNMLHGYPEFENLKRRIDLLVEQINLLNPDIVTLQEVPWTRATGSTAKYLAEQTGMNFVYLPVNGNHRTIFFSEGEAILSRYPLRDVDFVELYPRAGFFEHRVALKVDVSTPFGNVQIVSTHLTNGNPEINAAQARDLYDYLDKYGNGFVFVGGDFNAEEDSPQIRLLDSTWTDTYRLKHPLDPGLTCCADPVSGIDIDSQLEKRIDYLFLVPDGDVDVEVVDSQLVVDHPIDSRGELSWVSDHVGILTAFKFSPIR